MLAMAMNGLDRIESTAFGMCTWKDTYFRNYSVLLANDELHLRLDSLDNMACSGATAVERVLDEMALEWGRRC